MNLFYKCVSFLPLKLVFVAMKEVVRVRKIAAGVHHAHHLYHHGWFVMMATGWVKGDTWDAPEAAGRAGTVWGEQQGAGVGWGARVPTSQVFAQPRRMGEELESGVLCCFSRDL